MARYYFNIGSWKPTKVEWVLAGKCIQEEERKRVCEFVFKEDCKAALIGRVLLRYMLSVAAKIPWNSLHLTRTDKAKPVIDERRTEPAALSKVQGLSFNISHSGDYVVGVADWTKQLGVDVMKNTDRQGGVDDFFSLMSRNLTEQEWHCIKCQNDDSQKMNMFYRHWCLKESFVKAIGKGIGYSLQRLSFDVDSSSRLSQDEVYTKTNLKIDGLPANDWFFEEMKIGDEHCLGVATDVSSKEKSETMILKLFQEVKFEQMELNMQKLGDVDDEFWNVFEKKLSKN